MSRLGRSPSSTLALVVLVALAVSAPWPFGAVQPWAVLAMTALGLLASAVALMLGVQRGDAARPTTPLWPLLGFGALGLGQVVPLPSPLHALLAPGSHAVWRPAEPAARAVLGAGPFPVSLDPATTIRSVALIAALGLLAWLAAPALTRRGPAVAAASIVAVGGVALAVYAVYARARFGVLLYGRLEVPTVAPFGPFVSKNHFAGYMAMAALLAAGLAIGLAAGARRRDQEWTASPRAGVVVLAAVAALAMALAAIGSLSRGGTIALAAGALALLAFRVFQVRSRRALVLTLILAVVAGLTLIALVPPESHARMRSLSGASLRLDTWRDGLRLALSSPVFGSGLGAFHDAYPRFKRGYGVLRVEHAENDYVETFAEAGLVGLGLALFGGALLVAGVVRDRTPREEPVVRGIGVGAAAGLVALAVHSTVDFNLRIPSNAALAALLAAASAGAVGGRPTPLVRGRALLLALAPVGLLLLLAFLPAERAQPALQEIRRAAGATTRDAQMLRLDRAEMALGRFLRWRPAHAESWLLLAMVRGGRGDVSAPALARHAVTLDPERAALREVAERLERRARPPRQSRP